MKKLIDINFYINDIDNVRDTLKYLRIFLEYIRNNKKLTYNVDYNRLAYERTNKNLKNNQRLMNVKLIFKIDDYYCYRIKNNVIEMVNFEYLPKDESIINLDEK